MTYSNICHGVFLKRLNRFSADVRLNGVTERCHLKNTGRLGELLLPGAEVLLTRAENPNRLTRCDLTGVYSREGRLFNIDSLMPNKVFGEWLRAGNLYDDLRLIRPEVRYGSSRFDFYIEADGQRYFTEVKGVTLLEGKTAYFPDAPTLRGLKHMEELIACRREGYGACIAFILQMKGAERFCPNRRTQPEFAQALIRARQAGVRLLALDCLVKEDSITIDQNIEIVL